MNSGTLTARPSAGKDCHLVSFSDRIGSHGVSDSHLVRVVRHCALAPCRPGRNLCAALQVPLVRPEDPFLLAKNYSCRSARMGSTRLPRSAGSHTATMATPIKMSG